VRAKQGELISVVIMIHALFHWRRSRGFSVGESLGLCVHQKGKEVHSPGGSVPDIVRAGSTDTDGARDRVKVDVGDSYL
jgi:hypothetical protein